ncbi:hypothetical protein KC953_02840, partial [Candidatus Saccharibacteria bacterium]|nr:hypothetical protein [Candidatus Saccharibacteria bacterium]
PLLMWAACAGGGVGVGLSIWLFYFRKEAGTSLWIPRNIAHFLSNRAKATTISIEAFGLGLTSIIGELLFSLAPLCIAALVLIQLDAHWQLIGVLLYAGVALLPLLIIGLLIGNGRKLSRIQHWREANKRFLQFAAGSGLIILAVYVYVERVFTIVVANSLGVV